ncbi:unnamed protein product [Arabidopsis thaliana]|uniref:Putative F-box protein At3g13825 n=1 Tax=Arabidopsis thaliana TaxID=3702 RepID=FB143_ARATH|nr:RecName: Full=Putative F-box protein At3g13825 [Arabidopsis thaliana]BAB02906.1 unnamed protein product [Arabidopsis thaliana]
MTTLSNLSVDLVGEIFSRVPLISLSEVRCTCTTWNTLSWNILSENYVFGKADTSKQFLGFVVMNSKVCSLRLDLQGIHNNDFVDPSLKEINIVDQYDISNIFHCDGLLLCVRWIQPRSKYHKFHRLDMYAFGYDKQQQEPDEETVTLSCIRDEQLAVLYQPYDLCLDLFMEI